MNRRRFLKTASIAATVGLTGAAGCTGPGDGGGGAGTTSPEGTPTETPTETPTTTQMNETAQGAGTTQGTTGTGGGGQPATHYRFGGEVAGWRGREPQQIADATNPTLNLQADTTYRVTWENLDGAPHNFTIQDSDGNNLASTETMSSEGETLSLTFTASEEMARYICTVHPTTMVGEIQLGSG